MKLQHAKRVLSTFEVNYLSPALRVSPLALGPSGLSVWVHFRLGRDGQLHVAVPDMPDKDAYTRSQDLITKWQHGRGDAWDYRDSGTPYWFYSVICHMRRWSNHRRYATGGSRPAPPSRAVQRVDGGEEGG